MHCQLNYCQTSTSPDVLESTSATGRKGAVPNGLGPGGRAAGRGARGQAPAACGIAGSSRCVQTFGLRPVNPPGALRVWDSSPKRR